ncbi:SMR family transporter [Nocardiopsis dassonvillei]|uniref:DMT family transporter n=1 Tax=Nocardiopsis dassonvillei TaxID=2014 RepID=UPI002010492A|nr:SMR family transporter [Nocardiopsis dassonvillei]MCK9871124.1 SMR family transporter [Nocardiopsis dassonvillei]
MAWFFLVATIATEVLGAFATRASDGFTAPVPTALAVVSVVAAYYLFSLALRRGMPVGVAYGLWTALGVAAVAALGVVLLGEALTWPRAGGLLLVAVGTAFLQMGGREEGERAAAEPTPGPGE